MQPRNRKGIQAIAGRFVPRVSAAPMCGTCTEACAGRKPLACTGQVRQHTLERIVSKLLRHYIRDRQEKYTLSTIRLYDDPFAKVDA